MSTQPVKRLSQLEIDEVSLVDRPANQHGLVTITKRDEGTGMGFYDEHGNEVDEEQLESGDIVFDDQGEPIQLFSDDDLRELVESGELSLDDLDEETAEELVGVGKADAAVTGGTSLVTRVGRSVRRGYTEGRGKASPVFSSTNHVERKARSAGAHVGRNKNAYIAGSAAGTEENVRGRFTKSLGEQVLTDLSKALTDGDRDQVISKMADRLSEAEYAAQEAVAKAAELEHEQERAQYTEIAKGFDLPVDPEDLGEILQEVSKVLNEEQLDTLERILHTAAAAIDFEERGSSGTSPIMGYVGDVAHELVGKSAGDITPEQATTALFSANDEAYLDYLSEQRG